MDAKEYVRRSIWYIVGAFALGIALAVAFQARDAHATTVTPIFGGGTGTSTAPTYGKVLVGDSNGNYELTATSSLGFPVGGSGTVTSVQLGTPNSSLTITGTNPVTTSGTINADVNTAHANTWSALQWFTQNASTSQLTATSTVWFTGYTSAALTVDSNGKLTAYGGVTCTNQALTALSASLGSTCSSVTDSFFSGQLAEAHGGTGTSTAPAGQLIYGGGAGVYQSVATSSLSAGTGLTGSFTVVGTGGSIALSTPVSIANGGTNTNSGGTTNGVFYYDGTKHTNDSALVHLPSAATGVGTSTPWAQFSVSTSTNNILSIPLLAVASSSNQTFLETTAGGETAVCETKYGATSQPATSTNMKVDWQNTCPVVTINIGTSATTINVVNATTSLMAGSHKLIDVCNPGSTGGALTWTGIEWVGTAPTQTTTANQCDEWSFIVISATSTPSSQTYKVAGAASTGFQ